MKQQRLVKSMHLLIIAALVAMLIPGLSPAQTAYAKVQTSTSDLAVNLVSVPKTSKACDVFQAIFTVTNLGPDPAYNTSIMVHIPDAYHDIALLGVPYFLAVGETATISAVIWVGSFEPGETRRAWVGVTASGLATSFDPNLDNNYVNSDMKIVSQPVITCLPRY